MAFLGDPGTFDPITLGHIEKMERALHLFEEVTIAIATSETKKAVFSLEERNNHVDEIFKGNDRVKAIGITGLVVELAKEENSNILIRGLRAVSEFEYEFQLANMNRARSPDLESVFLTPKAKFSF
jgi:pantetheine-phosphate adenylyltransferase, bacterial